MNVSYRHYVPCVRWKQGEYQALLRLSDRAKAFITPLIEVPEIGFDFEAQTFKKTLDDHLAPFAKRVKEKWQGRPCFVDTKLIEPAKRMADGLHPTESIFDALRADSCWAVPVTGLKRDPQYQEAVRKAMAKDKRGICLRLGVEEAAEEDLKKSIADLLAQFSLNVKECDIILDLGAPPNFEPIEGFAKLIETLIKTLPSLSEWRSFAIIGTSFPASMGTIKQSPAIIQRSEWLLYKALAQKLKAINVRVPAFGDYAINHPGVLLLDMRLVKPFASIRYAIDDAWFIIKGRNVRDYKYEQYRQHCRTLTESSYYLGPEFSEGDCYINDCACGSVKTGSLTTWRWVGTNHHLEKVVKDISNFFAS